MKKALEGIKVVDLTSALSGPFCTMMLADFGADVLKIEPLHGDQCRTWGPIDEKSGESGFYCYVNRNKKGATLNLKSEKGKQMFYDLVKDADILVENYRGGVTKKLGIDYETVKKINPSIIYASCSGFGQYGPLTHRACYDVVAQAMGGMVNLTGFKDTDPVKVGPSVADHVSGIYLTVGVLAALHHRDVTGEGQQVDVSMFDTIFSLLENALVNYTMAGEISQRNGNVDPSIAPFDIFPCKDGFTALGVGNDRLFDTFCHTIPVTIDFMSVSSYGNSRESSGIVKIAKDLDEPILDKEVLVVEDIIDSGKTLNHLKPMLESRNPASLHLCTLLSKPDRREVDVPVRYIGFEVPDEFVVGYGLDYAQKYRNLPYIGVAEEE